MYRFIIKDEGPDVDIILTRAMLFLAAIATIVYRHDAYYYLNLVATAALFIAALFIRLLLVKFRINKLILLTGAALALFLTTRSFVFALVLLLYGYLVKFILKKPTVEISEEGIMIRKMIINSSHQWREFSNIILKDSLLTLDFKNNKLLQVQVDESAAMTDEKAFNIFCKKFI